MGLSKAFFFLLTAVLITLLYSCGNKQSSIPPMQLTLGANDAKPLGGKIWRTLAENALAETKIENNAKTFSDWYKSNNTGYNITYNNEVYFLAAPKLQLYNKEAEDMAAYLRKGNTLFIVTDYVSDAFAGVFNITIKNSGGQSFSAWGLEDTHKSLADTLLFGQNQFSYYFLPLSRYISTDSSRLQDTISLNENGLPDGVRIFFGGGELILLTNAAAFSNYFLLTSQNYQYGLGTLAYLPANAERAIWDDFYRRNPVRQPENNSMFSALLAIPAMRWAFWILLALSAIWVISNLFRKQRMIPLLQPNKNTTVEFTQTIARLYFNKKDNQNIALKMIQYFTDHMRSKYYLPHKQMDMDYAKLLAGKTNRPLEETEELVSNMLKVQRGYDVTDEELLILNRQITMMMELTG